MPDRCKCTAEQVRAGHSLDCPLNKALAPEPLPPVRKPFEEMNRDEMIVAYTALRASIAEYIADMHGICRASIALIDAIGDKAKLTKPMQEARAVLADKLGIKDSA